MNARVDALHNEPAHSQHHDLPSDAPAAARTAFALLKRLTHGSLIVELPDGSIRQFGNLGAPRACLRLHNWNVCAAALKSGDIGFAESYIAGDWSSPDLASLLRVFIVNRREVESVIYGSWWGQLAYRLQHWFNRNSKTKAQQNIHAHYDLGNAFYERWLDASMTYSAAIFTPEVGGSTGDLQQAQMAKIRRALRMAGLERGKNQRLLEIGCGWGSLAQTAALEFGSHVTGVSLSSEQLDWARDRMALHGLSNLADLRLQDYRDIADEPFDAICSIEMIEAVGREYWPSYFRTVSRLLKPGAKACIQSIVIDDSLFDRYLKSTDFIQQYIFPGGCLPSPSEFRKQAAAAGLEVIDEFAFGQDYAETLRRWRADFTKARDEVLALKPKSTGLKHVQAKQFDEAFIRTWEFYLAYCEAGFDERNIDVVQYTLRKAS